MNISYKAVSAAQQKGFYVEIRQGKAFGGFLKVRQVPDDLMYLLKRGRGAMDSCECKTREEAQLLARRMTEKAKLL